MDNVMDISQDVLLELDNQFTRTVAKNTYSYVSDKIKTFKASKNKDEIIQGYDEFRTYCKNV